MVEAMDKTIETKFFEAFKWCGVVDKCIEYIRYTYNLPPVRPTDPTKQIEESPKWDKYYRENLPKEILEATEAFDDSVIKYMDSPLVDEIEANLNDCQTDAQRKRYLFSLLKPFGDSPSGCGIARVYNPTAELTRLKEAIKDCEKDKAFLQNVNEDEQIDACNRMIKGCQDQIDWVLYVNHQFIDITCTFKDKEGSVERCLSAFVGVMKRFADRLDALLLTYGIDLMRLQRESGLYLKQYRKITDMDVYIGSMELAQMYIDALPKEPQPEQTKDEMIKIDKETLSQLDSPQAKELLQRLVDKGFCTSDYKWNTEKTIYQATLVAHHISIILWGSNKWKPFEELWKFKNMAQTFNRSTTDANQDSLREVDDLFPENKPQK